MPRRSCFSEGGPMHYVDIVESESSPGRYYVGSTTDVRRRIDEHNEGKSVYTNKYRPWSFTTYIAFEIQGNV